VYIYIHIHIYTHTYIYTVSESGGCDVTDLLLSHKARALYRVDCHESNIKRRIMIRKHLQKKGFGMLAGNIGAPRIFLSGADPEARYNLSLILKICHKNYVKTSEPARSQVTGNTETDKEDNLRICRFLSRFSTFQCTSRQLMSVADLGRKVNHVQALVRLCLQTLCFVNFSLGGELQPGSRPPPPFGCTNGWAGSNITYTINSNITRGQKSAL
jgi:hypothetical protein